MKKMSKADSLKSKIQTCEKMIKRHSDKLNELNEFE
jgi:hypothetical protein